MIKQNVSPCKGYIYFVVFTVGIVTQNLCSGWLSQFLIWIAGAISAGWFQTDGVTVTLGFHQSVQALRSILRGRVRHYV